MIDSPKNRYVVIPPRSGEERPWNPYDPADRPIPDCAYLSGVFVAMEGAGDTSGLTFFITSDLDALPAYGDDIVAIVISDEWCRIPRYALQIRAVFKTYGTTLPIHWRGLMRPTPYALAAFAQDIRTTLRRIPYVISALRTFARNAATRAPRRWRMHVIPLGFYRQLPVPYIEIAKRRFDVYFAGSVKNRSSSSIASRFTPKFLSRATMLRRLAKLTARRPDLAIATELTASFMETTDDEFTRYSKAMMETKICLVPRGTSLETYRYFEGLRAGCVVIAERLPHRWFYDGSPALQVRSWSELDELIPELMGDPTRLEALSSASRRWWSTQCSQEAVGAYISARIAPN